MKKLKKGNSIKAKYGFTIPDEEPGLKKIDFGSIEPIQITPKRQPLRNTINMDSTASMIPSTKKNNNFDLSSAIALGLSGIEAMLPSQKAKAPVVQPYENYSYNQNTYGTGSQMLMKEGGKVKKYPGGGKVSITNQHRTDWNSYVDWLEKKKLKGAPQLDKNNYGFTILDEYRKENPNTTISKDLITPIQEEFSNYRNWSLEQIKQKKAQLAPGTTPENYMRALSVVDGIPGQRTTSFKFPEAYLTTFNNGKTEGTVNQGFAKTTFKTGGKMTAKHGLSIENNNYSQLSPSMLQIEGNSHKEGGTDIDFMGNSIEAEKGEPITMDNSGNLTIFGKLNNPLTGNQYKQDAKMLAKKENKARKYFDNGLELIDNNDPKGKWSSYAFNSGKAMMLGGKQKLDEVMNAKEHLGELQNAHLQLIGQEDHTAANGKRLYPDGGKWKFNGTNTKGLDKKILDFVEIAKTKGLSGYSGPESGVSKRNTKSGRLSRHAQKQALDMMFSDKDAYDKILNDPDLSGYLINNGLTAINEYDPNIASKTGANKGHIHIGYDKGTPTADKFRTDAKAKWVKDNPNWNWNNRVGAKSMKPIAGAPMGDIYKNPKDSSQPPAQDYNIVNPPGNKEHDWLDTPPAPQDNGTNLNDYSFNFSDKKRTPYSNAKGLDLTNVMGEAYGIANNQEQSVFMQQYQPDLYNPYQVSFQDRINQNNRTFNASQQLIGYNPEALSTLSSEVYNANNSVAADEFRTNQGIASDITNKNISLLNETKGKNLQLADIQYGRQSQAKSNTKAINQEALNSISSKVLQNKKENNALRVYENLYPYFRFDKNYQKDFVGAPGVEAIDWQGNSVNSPQGTTQYRYKNGQAAPYQTTVLSPIEQAIKEEQLKRAKDKDNPKFKSGGKAPLRKWLSSI